MDFRYTTSDAFPFTHTLSEVGVPKFLGTAAIAPKQIDQEVDPPTPKFKESKSTIEDDDEYSRSGSDPGLVVIFNQQTFDDNYEARLGTNRDVNELITTFGRLGYNIEEQNVHNNKTRREIIDILNKLSTKDYADINSLVVVMLTHGVTDNVLMVRDAQINTDDIWQPFSNCSTLRNKPKFFIFQACKGTMHSSNKTVGAVIPAATYKIPLEADILVAFSTVEGSKSWRHEHRGSWFIQELCKNFNAYGRRDDVITLMLRVTKCVANNYYYQEEKNTNSADKTTMKETYTEETHSNEAPIIKQMPLLISTLTKKYYLCKGKDRNLLLDMTAKQNQILELIETINSNKD